MRSAKCVHRELIPTKQAPQRLVPVVQWVFIILSNQGTLLTIYHVIMIQSMIVKYVIKILTLMSKDGRKNHANRALQKNLLAINMDSAIRWETFSWQRAMKIV